MGALMNMRGVFLAAVCVVSCFVLSSRAQAQIFLEIPGVPGEATTPAAFANQISVSSFQFGAGTAACSSGPASISEVVITKIVDKSTTPLYAALRDHTVYGTATFRFIRSDGQIYQTYVMSNATLTGMSTSSGGDRPSESVSFSFSQMVMTYTFFDGSGKPGATTSTTLTIGACP